MDSLRMALAEDFPICWRAVEEGRAWQREQGFVQWSDSYPGEADVMDDLERGIGHLLLIDGEVAAYVCLDPSPEPAYSAIAGRWHSDRPYIVVRRITFLRAYAGRGLARRLFAMVDRQCLAMGYDYIRLNTGKENGRMHSALAAAGYSLCGTVVYRGIERLAYDKIEK